MKYKIPQLIPYLGNEELENLETSIRNNWITEGPFADEFLELIKSFTGTKYALLVPNGTLGLFLSLLALDVHQEDEVIVPDFTFNASGSSIVFAGAKPVFVDVNIDDYHILIDKIEVSLTKNTKAIMPVHLYGQCADLDPIVKLAQEYNIKIIEDAAQSLGVFYNLKNENNENPNAIDSEQAKHTGTIGDIGVISFFADKTITMGEGAVILTNNNDIFEKLKFLRNQGRSNSGTFIHPHLGMNFRVTDLQCGVGVAQLKKYDSIVNKKMKNYRLYKEQLNDLETIEFVNELDYCNFVPFRAPIKVQNLKGLSSHLESSGIQTRGFFYPLHKQPCFSSFTFNDSHYNNSNQLYEKGLALPVYPALTEDDITFVCKSIIEFYN